MPLKMEFKFVFRKLWLSTLSVAGGESFSLTRARCTAETSWLPGTVYFWYPAIRDLSSVLSCTLTYDTSVTVYRIPGQHGHVYLVGLYIFYVFIKFIDMFTVFSPTTLAEGRSLPCTFNNKKWTHRFCQTCNFVFLTLLFSVFYQIEPLFLFIHANSS